MPELHSQKGQELGTGGLIFGLEVGLLPKDNNNNKDKHLNRKRMRSREKDSENLGSFIVNVIL